MKPKQGHTTAPKATLLSLDIKGALDNVDRNILLQRLADKGIPSWIIKFVWSFLSNNQVRPSCIVSFSSWGFPEALTFN